MLIVLLLSACGDGAVALDPAVPITSTPPTARGSTTTGSATTAPAQNAPGLDLVTSQDTIKIGEEITITGTVKQMGLPAYSLYVDGKFYASDREAENPKATTHPTVQFVSATRLKDQGVFVLRGLAAGKVKISISANGEISIKSGGNTAFVFSNVASKDVEVTITGK